MWFDSKMTLNILKMGGVNWGYTQEYLQLVLLALDPFSILLWDFLTSSSLSLVPSDPSLASTNPLHNNLSSSSCNGPSPLLVPWLSPFSLFVPSVSSFNLWGLLFSLSESFLLEDEEDALSSVLLFWFWVIFEIVHVEFDDGAVPLVVGTSSDAAGDCGESSSLPESFSSWSESEETDRQKAV